MNIFIHANFLLRYGLRRFLFFMIKCRVCNLTKQESQYYISHSRGTVVHRICKKCSIEKSKKVNKQRKEKRENSKISFDGEYFKKTIFSDKYEVSNMAQIWNSNRSSKIKGYLSEDGYIIVKLYLDNGKKFATGLHRLVAISFIENPFNLPEVNHLDGDKSNNKSTNLEWCTTKQNINHAIDIGLRSRDINLRVNDMFDKDKIFRIRELIKNGLGNKEICLLYNCDHSTISKIRRGVHYSHF